LKPILHEETKNILWCIRSCILPQQLEELHVIIKL